MFVLPSFGRVFFHFVTQPPEGHSGGLVFACKARVNVELVCINKNSISLLVYSDPVNHPWLLTCFHGPTLWHLKSAFWNGVCSIASSFEGSWLCFGDFNCLAASWEKKGGQPFTSTSITPLQNLIESRGLLDLGYNGSPFTWSNNKEGFANIKEWLDRRLENVD